MATLEVPNPARLSNLQVLVSGLCVVGATAVSVLLVRLSISRRLASRLLCACAAVALLSWMRFGELHAIAPRRADERGDIGRVEVRRPLQFHEFFHYYIGAKYFAELGYLGLYDCTALANRETAAEDGQAIRVSGYVRDLSDVLSDKPSETASADCAAKQRQAFSPSRWAAFKADLRALQRLVPDAWWADVVDDKGLNPPPTFMVVAAALANAVPVAAAGLPAALVVTSIDLVLAILAYVTLRRSFGASAASLAAVTLGASFLAPYGFLGGAVLRFTWLVALVFALTAMRRDRFWLAGLLLGWSICDRVFPVAFAIGAGIPLAFEARRSPAARAKLLRFALGICATVAIAGVASVVFFGALDWQVFVARTARDAHVHNVSHVGLEKILTFRSWVPAQSFSGHDGLLRFRQWNERLDATWASERLAVGILQTAILVATMTVARKRRPFESCVLVGSVAMFTLAAPAAYYYGVLALIPLVLLRSALRTSRRPWPDLAALLVFQGFWGLTLVATRLWADAVVANLVICSAFAAFALAWLALWSLPMADASRARHP